MGRVISIVSVVAISMLFIYTPYLRGLFFDTEMYMTEMILAALFLINAAWISIKNPQKQLVWPYLLVFLLPLSHLLSLTVAETPHGAWENLFRWGAYASMFVLIVWARQADEPRKVDQVLPYVFQITGTWIAFFALFGLWGWVEFKDVMLGERMTGPFQYANTFAAVICTFWLYALVVLTKKRLPIWSSILFSLPLVAYGVGLLHSYSRGALLVFPVAWFLGLLLLKGKEQIAYLLYSLVSSFASFIAFRQITNQLELGLENPGMYALLISSIVVIGLVIVTRIALYKKLSVSSFGDRRYVRFLLPSIVVFAGILLVLDLTNEGLVYQQIPTSLQQRVTDINGETASLLGRTNVYQDAFKISNEAPLLGVGGEGWKILYPKNQELPYLNNEIHNGYLEVLLSTGWVGVLIFVIVFALLIQQVSLRIYKEKESDEQTLTKAVLPALAMIVMHSFIDFDFSYGTAMFIVFWLFAMGVPAFAFQGVISSKPFMGSIGTRAILTMSAAIVLAFGVYACRFYLAEQALSKTDKQLSIEEVQPMLERAVSLNPYQTAYQLNLANVYAAKCRNEANEDWRTKAIEKLQIAETLEPHNSMVLFGIGNGYLTLNDWEKAVQYFEMALASDPFNVQLIDSIVRVESQLATQFTELRDKEKAVALAKKAIGHYKDYAAKIEPFKAKEIPDKRPLELENATSFFIGQAYLILGENQQAIEQIKKVADQQLLVDAKAILVVALEALGQNEEAASITSFMMQQYPDFAQRVVTYRTQLIG